MKRKYIPMLVLGIGSLIVVFSPVQAAERWYTDEQVTRGKDLFDKNCSVCHGKNAEGTKDWKKRDDKGKLPPPPLDGTAHAWHHPMKILRKVIRDGGTKIGGTMPPFENKLSDEEINLVVAWFQSKWPDKIYAAWSKRNGPMVSIDKPSSKPKQTLKQLVLSQSKPSPIKGMIQSRLGGHYIYATKDGRYGVVGDLLNLETGENLTDGLRKEGRLVLLKEFRSEDMTILPAQGKEKSQITVFTDTSCPFCKKLHKEAPQLQKAGITVRYIPFSRGGKDGQGYQDLRSVWCAKDRAVAMDIAKGIKQGILGFGDCEAGNAVDRGYELGVGLGLRGTPAIVMPDGELLQGYRSASELKKLLKIN